MFWEYISKYKVPFSLTFCVVFSLVSIIWQKNPFSQSTIYFNRIAEQTNYLFKNIFQFPFVVIERISEYSELKEKYQKSLEEIEKYKLQKEQYEILLKENQKLRQILEFPPLTNYPEIKAEVLGIRLNSITPRILINKGKKDGIQPFMPVIAFTTDENNQPIRSVVGITAIVQDSHSIIQPIQHPQMELGVKINATNQWAILQGNSYSLKKLRLKYITYASNKDNKFFSDPYIEIKNSRVVTSGNDGIFPENIPVGVIVEKGNIDDNGFGYAYVTPYIELDKLEFVIVILKKPSSWSNLVSDNVKNDLPLPITTEYIPEEFLNQYKNEKSKNEKQYITQHQQKPDKTSEIENKTIEQPKKTKERIFNPNDPLQ